MIALRQLMAAACLAPAALAADVIRVPQDVGNIQVAIDMAQSGDVVLAAPFGYQMPIVVDGKGITLVADGTASLTLLEVRNVPAGETFVLDGFTLSVPTLVKGPDTPFTAVDNAGALRLQDCFFFGDPAHIGNWPANDYGYDGSPGIVLENCDDVSLHDCRVHGGVGADLEEETIHAAPMSGGSAIVATDSRLSIDDGTLTGGFGGSVLDTTSDFGGRGGDGVTAHGTCVVALSGCEVTGGYGGTADCEFFGCGDGGAGGSAIRFTSQTSQAFVRDVAFTPGPGGWNGDFTLKAPDGVLVLNGTTTEFTTRARHLGLASPVREGDVALFEFEGEHGDFVRLYASLGPAFAPLPNYEGTFLLGGPLVLSSVGLGLIPITGELDVALPVPDLGPGVEAIGIHVQTVFFENGATPLLGPARVLTLVDDGF